MKAVIRAKLDAAKSELEIAERELENLLSKLTGAPRAEKTTVTEVVSTAFRRLHAARAGMQELEQLLDDEEPDAG
jgi:hypothetical protein